MGMIPILLWVTMTLAAAEPDWSQGARIPPGGRPNPYQLQENERVSVERNGRLHAQIYPVEISGLLPPIRPLENFFSKEGSPLKEILRIFMAGIMGIKDLNDLMAWIGLHKYPKASDRGVYSVPYPNKTRPNHRMGYGRIATENGSAFSISCAACHSGQLFGKTVLGLTNRFPRSNEAFFHAKTFVPHIPLWLFRLETGATSGETELFARAQQSLRSVGVKRPSVLGLDTSLAQVAISLAHREKDEIASFSKKYQRNPRSEKLSHFVADSKPAVWWNVKYKNKWLSDGSVISGNPIYTNILWNEIGRGTDLEDLEQWLRKNDQVIRELTTAVFSSEAPKITDFFPAEKISLKRAIAGEQIFLQRCAKCHGVYEKAWNLPEIENKSLSEKLATINVIYHESTPVIDVGTDPQRRLGMKSLEQLNDLKISRQNGIQVKAQSGYVPPPLVGIWARWPYFHNNSIPNLCALLTRGDQRPKRFFMREAKRRDDFDFDCNGYKVKNIPKEWKRRELYFNTEKEGLSNRGHDEGIFLKNGKELLSAEDKYNLLQFLQTL